MGGKDFRIFIYEFTKLISSAIACNTTRVSIFFLQYIFIINIRFYFIYLSNRIRRNFIVRVVEKNQGIDIFVNYFWRIDFKDQNKYTHKYHLGLFVKL